VEVGEATATCGQRVNVRRAKHWMPCTAEVIGPVLVGDEQQKIGPLCLAHQSALMFSSLANWL
jgi:hypothetical protein